ncbi:S8 family serine peptidase [Deinococcus sp. AJ005]|uniref:S8 family peptidase n=1 Tax=Deinococcus sp. AJ005 TaxID=2652443 RepID=UPI0018657E82|nr:S8 family serine peptidase [Deinococcus sp. AJ005]
MKRYTWSSILALALTLGAAGGTGLSPIAGSSRPDAYARAGQPLILSVPEIRGRTVKVGGMTATIEDIAVTVTIPSSTTPGRHTLNFVNAADNLTLTSREVDVLPPASIAPLQAVEPGKVQLLVNPRLSVSEADALLNSPAVQAIGKVTTREVLPAAQSKGSPCGGTLAELKLNPGVSLEVALNALLQIGGNALWYPDPISTYGAPKQVQSTLPGSAASSNAASSFHYIHSPVIPRTALGLGAGSTVLKGKGITIAVLDTGFTSSIDSLNELAGRTDKAMNALFPFNPQTTFTNAADFWEGHGTQVAILAAGNQHGVATQARVLPIKVCAEGSPGLASCNTRDVLRGLCFALNQVPARKLVINLSLGGPIPINGIHAVLNWATSQGVVVVAAGGNQGQTENLPEFPAAYTQASGSQVGLPMLAVASVTPRAPNIWKYSAFSTTGTYLNISAPGEALDIGHPYLYSGTSFAAPLVAGAAALVKGANLANLPPPAAVRAFMLTSSRVLQVQNGKPMLRLSGY